MGAEPHSETLDGHTAERPRDGDARRTSLGVEQAGRALGDTHTTGRRRRGQRGRAEIAQNVKQTHSLQRLVGHRGIGCTTQAGQIRVRRTSHACCPFETASTTRARRGNDILAFLFGLQQDPQLTKTQAWNARTLKSTRTKPQTVKQHGARKHRPH